MRLLQLLALSLGLPGDYFAPYFTQPMIALRPLHYTAEVWPPAHLLRQCMSNNRTALLWVYDLEIRAPHTQRTIRSSKGIGVVCAASMQSLM
jgi:hypothetical protein